jgi:2',3'-cyclic-nucleotide 2'-phosphodiesterase (5'-nucleotidase family)
MSVKAFLLTVILLLSVCLKAFAGKKSASLEILYIANTNALIENCHCGNPSLGGLARIATVVKEERKNNPALILIEGGDFFNTYPFEEINRTVLSIYNQIKPDIIIPGENEFIDGLSLIKPFLEKNVNKIISSNYKIDNLNTKNYSLKSNVVFLSYLDRRVFSSVNDNKIIFNDKLFKSNYEKNKKHFIVLLYHGFYENVKKFIELYPEIDIVLSAHSAAGQIGRIGNTIIVGSGSDGEYVNKILLNSNGLVKRELIPVGIDIKQDKTVMKFINSFKETLKSKP